MIKITIENDDDVKVFQGEDMSYTCLVSDVDINGEIENDIYHQSRNSYRDRVDYIVTLLQLEEGLLDDVIRVFVQLSDNFFYEDMDIFVDDSTKNQ